jgi:transposase
MSYIVAGIDVHKRILMIAVADAEQQELEFECRCCGTTAGELENLAAWLSARQVETVVMESTAQYGKPVWLALEQHFRLQLAQAHSNRAPKGRKGDFRDTQRLVRRLIAGELILSFVPEAEQRQMRTLTRRRVQLTGDRMRLQSQLECLLEEARIQLSSVVTDLLGASGRRILAALAAGETEAKKLASLADGRLKCSQDQLQDALSGRVDAIHRQLLSLYLEQLALLDAHIEKLTILAAGTMHRYQEAIGRLAAVPGIRVIAAQQIVAEVGPAAASFPSAGQLCSWVGNCPGREESAGENRSGRCPKGNRYLRRTLCQAAQAAVKTKNSHFQALFRRLVPRLGYTKAIWAVARHLTVIVWKILHDGVSYQERGQATSPQAAKRRVQRMVQQLRKLGYAVQITPVANPGCTV